MTELARGTIADRPWGRTLGTLGLRGATGQLTLIGDAGKRYSIVFDRGAVVAAASPIATDAAVRIALTNGLVSSTQVAEIARRQQSNPDRDEIDVIAELARLSFEQAQRLRRRVVAHRAARTFSVERGEFVVDDVVTLAVAPGAELDVRAVIYLGARGNLSEQRLNIELGQLGMWFKVREDAVEDLPQFGLGESEHAVVAVLRRGVTLAELEAQNPSVEQRLIRALVYSLVACHACEAEARPRAASVPPPQAPRISSSTIDEPTVRKPARGAPPPTAGAAQPPTDAPTMTRVKPRLAARGGNADQVLAVITERIALLDGGADHFALLGVELDASPEAVRQGYFALARQLHPDRLTAVGIDDSGKLAQRLFAHVNAAFATLSDPVRRHDYVDVLRRGGEAAVQAEQAHAEQMTMRVLDAEEAFRRGEMALRRDNHAGAITEFQNAIALNPDEPDYHALLAWAQFCVSPDKMAAAAATRAVLERGIAQAPKAVAPRFYLGRIERMLGRDPDALRHFKDVLKLSPGHTEASTEVRVIEARLASNADDKNKGGGLFGRLKR